jgi:hypothetical protein
MAPNVNAADGGAMDVHQHHDTTSNETKHPTSEVRWRTCHGSFGAEYLREGSSEVEHHILQCEGPGFDSQHSYRGA